MTRAARRSSFSGLREHHVNRDYSYVKSDLMTVSAVGAVVVVFIVAMSYLL